jgi:hypothetical protein
MTKERSCTPNVHPRGDGVNRLHKLDTVRCSYAAESDVRGVSTPAMSCGTFTIRGQDVARLSAAYWSGASPLAEGKRRTGDTLLRRCADTPSLVTNQTLARATAANKVPNTCRRCHFPTLSGADAWQGNPL